MADTAERVLVGRFGAPHGVRGEVRVQSFTQDPEAIGHYGPLAAADGRKFTFKHLRHLKDNMLVARVEGVSDRTAAEALRHLDLYVSRAVLPPPDEEEFYVADLIGLDAVRDDGTMLGQVVDVPNYGGGDLIEIKPPGGGETLLFPFTKLVVPTIDMSARRIVVVPPEEIEAEDGDEGPGA